jgi:predicted Zn finger-like uncharacterized protein
MDVVCQKCQGKLKIADDKLPVGKTASIKCPRCQTRISITRPLEEEKAEEGALDDLFDFSEDENEGYDASEKPFDFIEEEGKTALLCEPEPLVRDKLKPTLELLEYHISEVPNSREARKKMR